MRVLVVDTDARASFAISRMLTGAKTCVDRPASAAQAVPLARRNHYDMLLLDLDCCPNLIREVRDAGESCPILALSGSGGARGSERAFDLGADGYLPKPFGRSELLDSIRSLERRGSSSVPRRGEGGRPVVRPARLDHAVHGPDGN